MGCPLRFGDIAVTPSPGMAYLSQGSDRLSLSKEPLGTAHERFDIKRGRSDSGSKNTEPFKPAILDNLFGQILVLRFRPQILKLFGYKIEGWLRAVCWDWGERLPLGSMVLDIATCRYECHNCSNQNQSRSDASEQWGQIIATLGSI